MGKAADNYIALESSKLDNAKKVEEALNLVKELQAQFPVEMADLPAAMEAAQTKKRDKALKKVEMEQKRIMKEFEAGFTRGELLDAASIDAATATRAAQLGKAKENKQKIHKEYEEGCEYIKTVARSVHLVKSAMDSELQGEPPLKKHRTNACAKKSEPEMVHWEPSPDHQKLFMVR